MECVRPRVASVVEGTSEREALPRTARTSGVISYPMSAIARTAATAVARSLLSSCGVRDAGPRPDVVGEQLSYLVPAPVGKQRVEPFVGSTRGVLERRTCGPPLEPGVRRIELCDRGIEVVDVEHHLYRDSPFVIEAEQLEQLVTRCPRARVRSAELQSGESQPLAAHCDQLDSVRTAPTSKSVLPRLAICPTEDQSGRSRLFCDDSRRILCCVQMARTRPTRRGRRPPLSSEAPARTRCPARRSAPRVSRAAGTSTPRSPRAFSASAAAPFSSYSLTARSAAACAPATSPAAPNTVASARQASP